MINNLGTPSSKLQINFGVLQTDRENSATGGKTNRSITYLLLDLERAKRGLRFVAPLPASRFVSNEGDRAQMKAWNEDTVNTPSLFRVLFVPFDTCVSKLWK